MLTKDYETLEGMLENYNYACQQLNWDASQSTIDEAIANMITCKMQIMSFVEELCT